MSYTVVGLFPTVEMADTASNKLDNAGFAKEDYKVSKYSRTGDIDTDDYDYDEDEKTTGFWGWLFGENESDKRKYSYAGTRSNVVTVYTDDLDRAEKAKEIMNDNGAVNVNDVSGNYMNRRYPETAPAEEFSSPDNNLTADERARIINKAKNDLYFIDNDRKYTVRSYKGMTDDMDSLGNKESF